MSISALHTSPLSAPMSVSEPSVSLTAEAMADTDDTKPSSHPSSLSTARARLRLLLDSSELIGATTHRSRRHLTKDLLLQRNLEIQAQLLIIDEDYDALLRSSESQSLPASTIGCQLSALDRESDALTEESDEIETVLYERHHLVGGGRCLLLDETLEARAIGERLGRGTKSEMDGNAETLRAKEQKQQRQREVSSRTARESEARSAAMDSSDDAKDDNESLAVTFEDSITSEQTHLKADLPYSKRVVTVIFTDSITGDKQSLTARVKCRTAQPVKSTSRARSNSAKRGKSKPKRMSKSDAAMMDRLSAQADENARRRSERAEENKSSLLGKLFDYFDTHIDVDSDRAMTEEEREERRKRMVERRKMETRSYPYLLGTIQFPLFPLPSPPSLSVSQSPRGDSQAEKVVLDFTVSPPLDGEDGCVVRSVAQSTVEGDFGDMLGYLPFPYHFTPLSLSLTNAGSSTFHPLLAMQLLSEARIISVESVHTVRSSDSDNVSEESATAIDLIECTVFVHDRFLKRTKLRSHLLRQAMLTLFRLFPPITTETTPATVHEVFASSSSRSMEGNNNNTARTDGSRDSEMVDEAISMDVASSPLPASVSAPDVEYEESMEELPMDSESVNDSQPNIFDRITATRNNGAVTDLDNLSTISLSVPAREAEEKKPAPPSSSPVTESAVIASVPVKPKRRIVPMTVTDEELTARLNERQLEQAMNPSAMPGSSEYSKAVDDDQEMADGANDEETGDGDSDIDESDDENDVGYGSEETDERASTSEDEFGLEHLDISQQRFTFVPLTSMNAPPAEFNATTVTASDHEDVEVGEDDDGKDGLEYEESFTLSAEVLAEDASQLALQQALTQSLPVTAPSSLHTLAWQKHDLQSLYDSLRPTPQWNLSAIKPSGLATQPLPFQLQALSWMMARETWLSDTSYPNPLYEPIQLNDRLLYYHCIDGEVEVVEPARISDVKGGILADQMGLGKTLQMISLVLSRPYTPPSSATIAASVSGSVSSDCTISTKGSTDDGGSMKVDAVIIDLTSSSATSSPTSIDLPSGASSPSVGDLSFSSSRSLLTALDTASDYSPSAALCSLLDALTINRESGKPEVKGTLIVSPLSIVYQWHGEIQKHAPSLNVLVYTRDVDIHLFPSQSLEASKLRAVADADNLITNIDSNSDGFDASGSKKEKRPRIVAPLALSEYDIVLTSYSVLAAEVNFSQALQYSLRKPKRYTLPVSPLLEVHWHRVVLDEAQRVQNGVSNSARMARRLAASHRWCVSGTPIGMGGLADLHGLMVFLSVEPYTNHSLWQHAMNVNTMEGMERLRALLKRLMWRHSKAHVSDQILLPPLVSHTHYLNFNSVEYEAYRRFEYDIRGKVYYEAIKGSLTGDNHQSKLDALRQMCDHPSMYSGSFLYSDQIDTMPVIAAKILTRALDETGEKERELCRLLNSLGLLFRTYHQYAESEKCFAEAWHISDAGVLYASNPDSASIGSGSGRPSTASQFERGADIETANTQVRAWRFIELITVYHLKRVYDKQKSQLLNDENENATKLSVLKLNLLKMQKQLNFILEDLCEPLTVRETEHADLIDKFNTELIPMWSESAAEDVRALLAERETMPLASFHDSALYRRCWAAHKEWMRREKWIEQVCYCFEFTAGIPRIERLLTLRKQNPRVCYLKRLVHQQLKGSYYVDDLESKIDQMLAKKLREWNRNRNRCLEKVEKMSAKMERTASANGGAHDELQRMDWGSESHHAHYEHLWWEARACSSAMGCVIDCKKAATKAVSIRRQVESAKRLLLKQCQNPSRSFVNDPSTVFSEIVDTQTSSKNSLGDSMDDDDDGTVEAQVSDSTDGGDSDGDSEMPSEPFPQPVVQSLRDQLNRLRVEAVQKHRHVAYLRNKLSVLTSNTSSTQPVLEPCPICGNGVVQPIITSCGHIFCLRCLQLWMTRSQRARFDSAALSTQHQALRGWESGQCPTCREQLSRDEVVEMPQSQFHQPSQSSDEHAEDEVLNDDDSKTDNDCDSHSHTHGGSGSSMSEPRTYTIQRVLHAAPSWHGRNEVTIPPLDELSALSCSGLGLYGTKVDCIMRHLKYLYDHHPRTKSLVFSQFHRMLTLFAKVLDAAKIPCLLLHGDDSKSAALIQKFQTDPTVPILLLSLRRDSSGLTLVSANHVFVVEPSLDSSVESQAINRIHRIGQRHECHVHKFVMRNSIEEKIDQQLRQHHSKGQSGDGGNSTQPSVATNDNDSASPSQSLPTSERNVNGKRARTTDEYGDHSLSALSIDYGLSQRGRESLDRGALLDYLGLET